MNRETAVYDDGRIRCDDGGLTISHYYLWGSKRIPYAAVRGVRNLPLTGANKVRRWRIWGSGDCYHWWNLDPERPGKDAALVIDVGRHVHPTITPQDPDAVARILAERTGS